MKLRITAFGNSPILTIGERAIKIMNLHSKFCDIIEIFEWDILNRKTEKIDIREPEKAYPSIYQNTKSGLNAKAVKIIRYKEDDVADVTSMCGFYRFKTNPLRVSYSIGYPSVHFPSLVIAVEYITDTSTFNEEKIVAISKLFIEEWNPCMLNVTDMNFFHGASNAHKLSIPWTGWFTYVSNNLLGKVNDFGTDVENMANGKLIWTTKECFDISNPEHLQKALALEDFFDKNNIRITTCYTQQKYPMYIGL